MNYQALITSMGQIGREYDEKNSPESLLWNMITKCVSQLGLLDFIIYTYDENTEMLTQDAGFGYKFNEQNEIQNQLKVPKGKGIVGDAAEKMDYQKVDDTSLDQRYIEDGCKNKSELTVPIIWNRKLIGVLDSEHPQHQFFKDMHLHTFYMISSFLGPRIERLQRKRKITLSQSKYYEQFIDLLENEQCYKDEKLSLENISARLGINKCYLSKVINESSQKKFTEIVNTYRVEDVKKALTIGKHKKYTLLSLAYDAGFSSKASFNAAFKKHTGQSPSAYMKQNKA